jgi:tetratricopeptide (TPR) repeat protein
LSERALAVLPEADKGTERELALLESHAISSMFTQGDNESVRAAIQRGLEVASVLRAGPRQLRLMAGLNLFLYQIGDFRGALRVAEESAAVALALADPAAAVLVDWMLGVTHHLIGDQRAAQLHGESGLAHGGAVHWKNRQLFGYDHRIGGLAGLAGALWLRGFADRAVRVARQAIEEASQFNNPLTLCIALTYTVTVFFWMGDWQVAEESITKLIAETRRYSLGPYHALGLALQGELMFHHGDYRGSIALLSRSLEILATEQHLTMVPQFLTALAQGLSATGQFDPALATIERAIAQRDRSGALFDMPEMLRIKAQILMLAPRPEPTLAQACLRRSLELARVQSALSWELRTAVALARMQPDSHARETLRAVYARFVEGFETPDLRIARSLLEDTQSPSAPWASE